MGRCLALVVAFAVALSMVAACGPHAGPTTAELHHPLVGTPAPLFARPRIGGGTFDVSAVRRKLTVVTFWATWCEPCKKAFPQLQRLSDKYGHAVALVGVCEDDEPSGIEEFLATYDGKFDVVWDDGKKITARWQPKTLPASFVVDSRGIVRFVHLGTTTAKTSRSRKS